MEIWLINPQRNTVVGATLIQRTTAESTQVCLDDGQRINVSRRLVFDSEQVALQALARLPMEPRRNPWQCCL